MRSNSCKASSNSTGQRWNECWRVFPSTPAGERALDKAIEDDLVASVLLLHGLHPDSIETRVLRALDNVRPYLRSHGGEVELVSVREGVVRIKLTGSCGSCPSSSLTIKTRRGGRPLRGCARHRGTHRREGRGAIEFCQAGGIEITICSAGDGSRGNNRREAETFPASSQQGGRPASASTGVNLEQRGPIDPRMPNAPPA